MHSQQQSRLLQLPVELQLTIFENAIIEPEPLLINCGCDSSYSGDFDKWREAQKLWDNRTKLPPFQPGLTRTCALIREVTLPMFYKKNLFRAHYCHEADFGMVIKWLKMIGLGNRRLLADFCLWDFNRTFDRQLPRDLGKVMRSEVFHGMGGSMETLAVEECCCHRVTFGEEDEDYYGLVPGLFDEGPADTHISQDMFE